MTKDAGVRYVKFDLHVHTPASKDFCADPTLNKEQAYCEILDNAIANELEIIAITDHNTFEGYNYLRSVLDGKTSLAKKYTGVLVLCGIEITCFSKHLLAIFDTDFSQENQRKFLDEIGITKEAQGTENAMADLYGPSVLMEIVTRYGGISILAHADAKDGFLYSVCRKSGEPQPELAFRGKSLAKILTSSCLTGLQVANSANTAKICSLLKNADYRRKLPLAFFAFSDCHGNGVGESYSGKSGKYIGCVNSIVKLSNISFSSLKMALADPETRMVNESLSHGAAFILGCAISSDIIREDNSKYCFVRFNPEMNCIIGARGTGKSTILEIIQYILTGANPKIGERFFSAILFVQFDGQVFAISDDSKMKIYQKRGERFVSVTSKASPELQAFLTTGYRQRQFYEYSKNPNGILDIVDDFLVWRHRNEYEKFQSQIKHNEESARENLQNYFQMAQTLGLDFLTYLQQTQLIKGVSDKSGILLRNIAMLHSLRQKMIEQLNLILKGRVSLSLTRKISASDYIYYTKEFPQIVARKIGRYYDYQVEISNFMKRVFAIGMYRDEFDFFKLLMEAKYEQIISSYNLSAVTDCMKHLNNIRKCVTPDELLVTTISSVELKYNINSGISKTEAFRNNSNLSMGQHAVALLLLILNASYDLSDNRPLLMDQPEDDLDNSYIYNTLVAEFRRSKSKRQIIISTHNANIPVASDAENIILLRYEGTSGYVAENGSLDKPEIADGVLETLEGGKEALERRNEKYHAYLDG